MAQPAGRHYLSEFDAALGSYRDNVLMMASLTARNLENARVGLFTRDLERCNTAIADDEEIDALEEQMGRDGLALLMRFQPVASDLRVTIATMKFSVNLERLSDLAVNIARRARKLIGFPPIAETAGVQPIFDHVTALLGDAISAFSTGNAAAGQSLKAREVELREKSRDFAGKVTQRMSFEVGESMQGYLEIVFILRLLDQIATITANLGDDIALAFSREATSLAWEQ